MFARYCLVTIVIFCGIFRNLQTARLICFKGSMNNNVTASLENPTTLLNTGCFTRNLKTVIYTHGFNGSANNFAASIILRTYLAEQQNRWNVMALDWSKEAADIGIGGLESYASHALPNVVKVGKKMGRALLKLAKADNGINMAILHLVGFSLGAHLMGYASRCTLANNYTVARITGLDPSGILLEGNSTSYKKLGRDSANFVDIIHANPGDHGLNESTGTIDVWPNYSTDGIQPGCPKGTFKRYSKKDLCSHTRAVMYYSEAIVNNRAFLASAATDYQTWLNQGNLLNDTIYLTENDKENIDSIGNYFLVTNSRSPFGKGRNGAYNFL